LLFNLYIISCLHNMISAPDIPPTMRAVVFQGSLRNASVQDGVSVPRLRDLPEHQRPHYMIIHVEAVALAPDNDVHSDASSKSSVYGSSALTGAGLVGVVVELANDYRGLPFVVGDRVVVRNVHVRGHRGTTTGIWGEYARVPHAVACRVRPPTLPSVPAAILAHQSPAWTVAHAVPVNACVAVLGAGSVLGSHVCQFIRHLRQPNLLMGVTSHHPQRLLEAPLLCDRAFSASALSIWDMEEFLQNPLDVIVDLTSPDDYEEDGGWYQVLSHREKLIIKPSSQGGLYIAIHPFSTALSEHRTNAVLRKAAGPVPVAWRALSSRTLKRNKLPAYVHCPVTVTSDEERTPILETMHACLLGHIQAIPHAANPFPFTTAGVQQAFATLVPVSSHNQPQGLKPKMTHGTVVIQVQAEPLGKDAVTPVIHPPLKSQ
jgi:NADPH:quinone reductase-like Zn-dependent oxidoreductase